MLQFLPLPILWLLFFVLGISMQRRTHVPRNAIFAGASLFLLAATGGVETFSFYVALGLAIILTAAWIRTAVEGTLRRVVLVGAIIAVVLMIVVFLLFRVYFQKYFVALPSLSYLGFRAIALLVSNYRQRNIDVSSAFMQIFFFPMLSMGPIARAENFLVTQFDHHAVLRRLAMGFPMLIAGHLTGQYVLEKIQFLTDVPWWRYWVGALANSFEFYFTFAGYTHLIIGLGLLAGFKLPENFNNPYFAKSISDFWRRWHMSLSFWIRDYLYIPLGGSRKGLPRKCFNLLLAMGVCGVWHGLELHYLLWGLLHGALLAIESVMDHFKWQPLRSSLGRAYAPVKVVLIFGIVTFGWLLFKYRMGEFVPFIKGMFSW